MFHLIVKKPSSFLLFLPFVFTSLQPLHQAVKSEISNEGFLIEELFTSEGCSSCPPADDAVGRLIGWKKNIFVLSFHVDYWNYLGWKDMYSDPAYSSRQQEYGSRFHLNSIYTPQIVVNGKVQFVGSDESRLRETIKESLKEIPAASIQIKIQRENKNQITVHSVSGTNTGQKLNIALLQNSSPDFIQRGENKGKTLNHFFIVRDFQVQSNKGTNTFHLTIPAGLQTSACSVVVFVQDSKTGQIISATGSAIP